MSERDVMLCSERFLAAYGERIAAVAPDVEVVGLVPGDRLGASDLERITSAFMTPDLWPEHTRSFLGTVVRCPNLVWLQIGFAGTDARVFQDLLARGVAIHTASGATAPAIAETVMMYLLHLSRRMPELGRARAERRWAQGRSRDLSGQQVGIVGYGSIGAEVARLAIAFGMRPIGLRRSPRGDEVIEVWPAERLADLLRTSDAIVVTAPLTDETRGMIGADQFALMKPGAWFVNVGRGAVVDEGALIDALTSGRLGGAGLDVFATEPLPPESPLWTLDNVVMTPHCSGDSPASDRRAIEIMFENLRRRTAGEPLLNPAR